MARAPFILAAIVVGLSALILPQRAYANPDGVAVIIGNADYAKGVPRVDFAANDAAAFKRYVTDILKFDERNIIYLPNATQAAMETAFGNERSHEGTIWQYLNPAGTSDVVIFYSGHGVPGLKDGRGYLLPVDADPQTAEINGYPIDLLYENLGKLTEAQSVTVYLDACFSGSSDGGALIRDASPVFTEPVLPQETGDARMTVLTAASDTQLASWHRDAQQGLFTHHLLNALYGDGDKDGDGAVTASEAKAYLDRFMTADARRSYRRNQVATLTGSDAMILAAAPSGGFPDRPPLDQIVTTSWTPTGDSAPSTPNPDALGPSVTEPASAEPDSAAFAVIPLDETRYAMKNVNTRSGPGTDHGKVRMLQPGEEVSVTGQVDGSNWLRIRLADGRDAFVFAPLLGETPPVVTASASPAAVPAGSGAATRYAVLPIRIGGRRADWAESVLVSQLGNLPQSTVVQSASARSTDIAITMAISRLQIEQANNAGAEIAQDVIGGLFGGLGLENVVVRHKIADALVVLKAENRKTGEMVVVEGMNYDRYNSQLADRDVLHSALQAAVRDGSERLMRRLMGQTLEPRPDKAEIRAGWHIDSGSGGSPPAGFRRED